MTVQGFVAMLHLPALAAFFMGLSCSVWLTPSTKVKSEGQLMEMLFAKRIDAFPIREQVLNEIRRTLPAEKSNLLETGEKPFSEPSLHIISSKNKTGMELIDKINAAINSSACN